MMRRHAPTQIEPMTDDEIDPFDPNVDAEGLPLIGVVVTTGTRVSDYLDELG